MATLLQRKRSIVAALVAALSLGASAWATSAQARGGGGNFGGGGAHFGGGAMHFGGGGMHLGGGFGGGEHFGGLHMGSAQMGGARFAGRTYSGSSDYGWDEPLYGSPYEYDWAPWGVAGVASGAMVGGLTTPEESTAYCSAHYRSYDPVSRTFLGFDRLRHACG